jgi:hypothetical protein
MVVYFKAVVWSIYGHLVFWPFVIFSHLAYFMVIWYIFPVLVFCTKKNLATLIVNSDQGDRMSLLKFGPNACISFTF